MNLDPRLDLIAAARQFYEAGWMLGTAGNLSRRLDDDRFWITASGKNKGELTLEDFVQVQISTGVVLEAVNSENRPSAETTIHQVIYSLFPAARTCYHVHSVEANLISNYSQGEELLLPPLEMVKGLGIWLENPQVSLPVFPNYLEVPKIAREIQSRFEVNPPAVPALLIRNHGVTVWADSPKQAQNYLEITEFIFRYLVMDLTVNGARFPVST